MNDCRRLAGGSAGCRRRRAQIRQRRCRAAPRASCRSRSPPHRPASPRSRSARSSRARKIVLPTSAVERDIDRQVAVGLSGAWSSLSPPVSPQRALAAASSLLAPERAPEMTAAASTGPPSRPSRRSHRRVKASLGLPADDRRLHRRLCARHADKPPPRRRTRGPASQRLGSEMPALSLLLSTAVNESARLAARIRSASLRAPD